jgi:hypothetical protein
MILGVLEIAA